MKTNLKIDPELIAMAKSEAVLRGKSFKEVIDSALRIGLERMLSSSKAKPYRTKARPLGLRPGLNYDKIEELLERG